MAYCVCILAAAGSSARFGEDKLTLEIGGVPVAVRSMLALQSCRAIDEIVVVTRGQLVSWMKDAVDKYAISKTVKIIAGGATRTMSVATGLNAVCEKADIIAIHDAARPFVCAEDIEKAVEAAAREGAAALAVPVKDTIKTAENGFVTSTLPREKLWAVQTPQVFKADIIRSAYAEAGEAVFTDDCAVVERCGRKIALVEGSCRNIKITTREDIAVAKAFIGEI